MAQNKKARGAGQVMQNARYKVEGRREKNKARKLASHIKRNPHDVQAILAIA